MTQKFKFGKECLKDLIKSRPGTVSLINSKKAMDERGESLGSEN